MKGRIWYEVVVMRIRVILSVSVIALGTALAVTVARATSEPDTTSIATYAPLPRAATTSIGVTFTRLTLTQLDRVRISETQALAVAKHWEAFSGKHPRISVHIGSFTDAQVEPAVRKVPAYLVISDGVIVPNSGPVGGRPNHEHIEVINAVTGRAVEGFSYR